MRVLVLGGTGAIGSSFTKIVSSFSERVVVTSRRERSASGCVEFVKGNARDIEFLKSLMDDPWDVIVDFMVYSTKDFEKRIDLLLSRTNQYVFISSARVYADCSGPIVESSPRLLDVSEDFEFLATDAYPLAKARQEDMLFNCEKKNWSIIRPYITYGRERLQLGVLEKEDWLYRALKGRTAVFCDEMLKRRTTMTYGGDVAAAIAGLVGKDSALGETFNITSPEHMTWGSVLEVYQKVAKGAGYDFKVKTVDVKEFRRCNHGKYQIIYDRMYDRVFDNSKIRSVVENTVFSSVEQTLSSETEEFLKLPSFLPVDWSYEGMRDQITGELAGISEIKGLKNMLKYIKYRFVK